MRKYLYISDSSDLFQCMTFTPFRLSQTSPKIYSLIFLDWKKTLMEKASNDDFYFFIDWYRGSDRECVSDCVCVCWAICGEYFVICTFLLCTLYFVLCHLYFNNKSYSCFRLCADLQLWTLLFIFWNLYFELCTLNFVLWTLYFELCTSYLNNLLRLEILFTL